MNEFSQLALDEAAKSPCEKRKVGAVIVDSLNKVVGKGHNYNTEPGPCECSDSSTYDTVIHAEVAAIRDMEQSLKTWRLPLTAYCTHTPCEDCQASLIEASIHKVVVVEQFMKFDSGKLNYDLIPPSWIELDAEVLTKGAQKYKPNNWKEVDPKEIMRYYSAAMRHIQDWKKFMEGHPDGHLFDDGEMGIGTHHLANARTNLGFLLTLTETLEKAEEIKNA